MTRCFLLCLALVGCRYLGPVSPQVTPERPALLAGGNTADPSRQTALPGRRCLVDCGAGRHCDERTAQCEADGLPGARDGGVPWLP